MAVYSIILKSQLEGAKRLDAEYYQPEFLDVSGKISKLKPTKLNEILDDIRYGLYVEPDYQETGVNFIRALNLVETGIGGKILKIKNSEIPSNEYLLKQGDILIVRSGANTGNVGLVEKNLENSTFGSYTICLRTTKLNPYFLYIFLNSRFGKLQTQKLQTGMAQPNLNIPNIEEIKIPLSIEKTKQREIEKIVLNSFSELENSKSFYSQAEEILLKELGLADYESEESLCGVVNFSEIKKNKRMDAEFFTSGWQALERKIKNTATKKLGELAEITKGIEPGAEEYKETGKQFIRVSSLSKEGINLNDQKLLDDKLYQELKKDYQPEIGEILLTKDATPGIAYVLKENLEAIVAGGILRLKLKEKIEAEYLALILNSLVGQEQAERDAGGSIIKHWKPEQIKNVLIPIISNDKQKIISDLVKKSFDARKKSKELLDEAKRKVEEIIENN